MLAIAIGIFLIGVGLAVAVPLRQNSVRNDQAAIVVEDLREFARAFQDHFKKRGAWPAAANAPGQIPPGMDASLDRNWRQRTPIGGGYLWAPDALHRGHRYRATIMFWPLNRSPLTQDPALLEAIDRQIDDGNLHSGNFQLGYRDQPFLVIEP